MLQLLDYSVDFPTTGRSLKNRIEFAPGVTAITGRNEVGKTVVIEMIRYALFGKAALRGLASDYKNLNVFLSLTLPGKLLEITRAPRSEQLLVNGEVVAVGAEAINKTVPALLGYGLDVFDVTQASLQGDIGRLTEMRPTARRQMVDQLIGLDLLETIEKDCKKEARAQDILSTGLMTSVVYPEEPKKPEGYLPVAELEQHQNQILELQMERKKYLEVAQPVAPEKPVGGPFPPISDLEAEQDARQKTLQLQAQLQGQLKSIPIPATSREELEKALAWQEYEAEVARRGAKPIHDLVYLMAQSDLHDAIDANQHLIKKYEGVDTVTCPKCEHEFVEGLSDDELKLVLSLTAPTLSRRDIEADRARTMNWVNPPVAPEQFKCGNIQQEILAHARQDERKEIEDKLAAITIGPDRSEDLRAARAYQQDMAVFSERSDRYAGELANYTAAQEYLAANPDRSEDLAILQRRLGEARAYDAAVSRYTDQRMRYDEVAAQAKTARQLGEGFDKGAAALLKARASVKQELAPSLSKAASALINAMTGGERRFVDVDHEFNIMVDGQPLQTLSGSGKSVVNLALRLGLGQVLTSKVLPIFLGDEIDKDMDETRSSATHNTLNSLKSFLSQIIIVTHKPVEVDTIVRL